MDTEVGPSGAVAATIRVLVPRDATQYRALMLHAYEHAADAFTSTPQERAAEPEEWWAMRIAHPGGLSVAFGAERGGELVGAVAIEFSAKPKTRHKGLLIGMYVRDPCRGLGLGRALLDAAVQRAQMRDGIRLLQLTVTEGNESAIGLYRSAGFEVFGTEPMAILTPGGYKSKLHLWRQLTSADTGG